MGRYCLLVSACILLAASTFVRAQRDTDFYFGTRVRCHTCDADFTIEKFSVDHPCLVGQRERDVAYCSVNSNFCKVGTAFDSEIKSIGPRACLHRLPKHLSRALASYRSATDEKGLPCGLRGKTCFTGTVPGEALAVEVTRLNGVLVTYSRRCADKCSPNCYEKGFGMLREQCTYCCRRNPACGEKRKP